jgi:hypothetical protein
MLDFQTFAALDRVGPSVMPTSGAAVEIDSHWLGGDDTGSDDGKSPTLPS